MQSWCIAHPWEGQSLLHVQVKEILAYAAQRFIEVVPEIELPGHCGAALASYPYLGCRGDCSPLSLNTLFPLFRARQMMFDTVSMQVSTSSATVLPLAMYPIAQHKHQAFCIHTQSVQ